MKKLKIMLLSLALFAVVGAALAFKARFNTSYCTAPTDPGQSNICNVACPDITQSTTIGGSELVCTVEPIAGKCDVNGVALQCNTTTRLTTDK